MSNNLFKSYYLNRNTNHTRVINSNEMVAQRMERIRMVLPEANPENDGFEPVNLFAESSVIDAADVLSADRETEESASSSVMKAAELLKETPEEPVYEGPTPEELIAQAKKEIEVMYANANSEMDALRMRTIHAAQAQGYEEGKQRAEAELQAAKQELEAERRQMQEAYERQIEELEPLFVRTLTGIYEKVFAVGLENQQEIVVSLLHNAMKKMDGCKNFLLHISAQDYPYVKEHREELLSDSAQEGTVIDIIEDSVMREGECTIETINGIYDCGIGTQMKELRRKLELLSYDGQQES